MVRNGFIMMILALLCFFPLHGAVAAGLAGTAVTMTNDLSNGRLEVCKVNVKDSSRTGAVSKGMHGEKLNGSRTGGPVAAPANAQPALVTDLRYWSNPDYTRVVIVLDREVKFTPHKLRRDHSVSLPERIYLDFDGARIAPGVKDISIGDGLLKTARVGQYQPDVVRVVLDIENIRDYKIFPLSDPYRVIIDVKGERPTEISRIEESIRAPRPDPVAVKGSVGTERGTLAGTFKPAKIRRIVVDPGHGGHDPGAVGADGLKEKDVVLALGLKVSRLLKKKLGVDVVMTRSTDVFIPLEERTAIANKVNADLFLSIHANASLNRSAAGIETYYLNLAKTDKAVRVAARENNTSLEKVGLLQTILFDLMANYKINDSARLADEVQTALHGRIVKKYQGTRNLGVKQGPFYVLVGATMPSILVETAFISNKEESQLLRDETYQGHVADGIVDGVQNYIESLH